MAREKATTTKQYCVCVCLVEMETSWLVWEEEEERALLE
jgi:hypothetical protein